MCPHLTADQARAHADVAFVWAVVDTVMVLDPRAWWLRHWLDGTAAFQTCHVADGEERVLYVGNDDVDDYWQLIGTTGGTGENGVIAHVCHAVEEDPTLMDVLDLAPGEWAVRDAWGMPWRRSRGAGVRPSPTSAGRRGSSRASRGRRGR